MSREQIMSDYNLKAIDTELLESITLTLKQSLKADIAGIVLYGDQDVYVLTRAFDEHLEVNQTPSFSIKESIGINAIDIKRPLFVVDTYKDKRTQHSQQVTDVFKIRSMATYPIMHVPSGQMIATISCLYTQVTELTNDQKIIFQAFGKTASKIFNHAADNATKQCEAMMDAEKLKEYNQDLIDSHQYGFDETAYKRAINYMVNLTGASTGVLVSHVLGKSDFNINGLIINNEFSTIEYAKVADTDLSRFITSMNERQIVLLNTLDESYKKELSDAFSLPNVEFENCLGIPLLVRNNLVGFIALFNSQRGFITESLDALKGIISAISSLVINDKIKHIDNHYQQQIEVALKQDELTSIPNMTGGVEYLESIVKQDNRPFTLCVIDLDKFSYLNTIYNRSEGDIALVTITNRVNELIRKQDFFSRVGGDMLMLVLDGHQRKHKIQDILDVIAKPIDIQEESVSISGSAAYLHGPIPDITGERHLSFLFNPLYKAKQHNRIEFADTTSELMRNEEAKFLQDFNYAMRENQITLYGLPTYSLSSNDIMCIEVLSRWEHPIKGILSPSYFLSALNKDHRSLALFDYAVIMKSIHFLLASKKKNITCPMLCINVSPALLTSKEAEDLMNYFAHDLDQSIVDNICFELIEWDEHSNKTLLFERIAMFKALGIRMALDDFGTGNSNIDRLMTFPIDIVKIDQSFLLNMEKTPDNLLVIQSMIDIAKNLNKIMIVEGVETKEQVELLRQMGCDNLQGFYFQKPAPLDTLVTKSNA